MNAFILYYMIDSFITTSLLHKRQQKKI